MIELASNGVKTPGQEWYGRDASQIAYPAVSSCITVTCVVPSGLAGLHLASMLPADLTNKDIATFAAIAKGASAMYVVGMLSSRWATASVRNRTGLTYTGSGDSTLIARLREATGYDGVVNVADTSEIGGEITITASLARGVVTFTTSTSEALLPQPLTAFEFVAGNVMLGPPPKSSGGCCGCIIL